MECRGKEDNKPSTVLETQAEVVEIAALEFYDEKSEKNMAMYRALLGVAISLRSYKDIAVSYEKNFPDEI